MITSTWWGFYSIIDDVLGHLELAIIVRGGGLLLLEFQIIIFFTADPIPQFSARALLVRRGELLGLMQRRVLFHQQATAFTSFGGKINK